MDAACRDQFLTFPEPVEDRSGTAAEASEYAASICPAVTLSTELSTVTTVVRT